MPENEFPPVPATRGLTGSIPDRAAPGRGTRLGPVLPVTVAPFALHAAPRITQCPPQPQDLGEPGPENLAYGLTLPSAVATPVIAQEAAWIILDAHCLEEKMIDPALVLVDELVAYACGFTGSGEQIHLGLRQAEAALQIMVYDTHAPHTHARLAAACDERRRNTLAAVPDLVEAHLGTWGFGAAYPPSTGTCTWATLLHNPGTRAT